MKRRILVLALVALMLLTLSSCVAKIPESQEVYSIGGANFEILNYDFITYTNIGVNGHSSSKSYGFYIEAESECSLVEYTATLEFYSSEKNCIFKDTITSACQKKARECLKKSKGCGMISHAASMLLESIMIGQTFLDIYPRSSFICGELVRLSS